MAFILYRSYLSICILLRPCKPRGRASRRGRMIPWCAKISLHSLHLRRVHMLHWHLFTQLVVRADSRLRRGTERCDVYEGDRIPLIGELFCFAVLFSVAPSLLKTPQPTSSRHPFLFLFLDLVSIVFEKTEIAQKGRRGIEAGQLFSNVSIAIMGLGWHADVSDVIVNSWHGDRSVGRSWHILTSQVALLTLTAFINLFTWFCYVHILVLIVGILLLW